MMQDMFNSGAMPALERLVQFTGQRHRVLTNNIANLSTPYFKPADLDPRKFQSALADAMDRRRLSGNPGGSLEPSDTDDVTFLPDRIEATPRPANDGVLFHDQNNRDLERTMQKLAENTLAHNAGLELMRNQFEMLRLAIRERA